MLKDGLIISLNTAEKFFKKTIEVLSAENALFRPSDELYTVAAHIDHVADSVTWFIDGAFRRTDGFDLNFEQMIAESAAKTDFDAALTKLTAAFRDARIMVETCDEADLHTPMPKGPIMGGAPKLAVVNGIVDHTAHHRGSLAVYCRLLGKVPPMPYL